METLFNQRWRDRRDSYRPAREPIDTRRYDVATFDGDAAAKAFVCRHHYSAEYVAARFRFGLFRGDALVGVAVMSHPVNDACLTRWFGTAPAAELGRLVLLDDVPANGETWFVARCFELLRRDYGLAGVLSHSDPEQRRDAAGRVVFPGHLGTVYQAHNARYYGRTRARWLKVLPDGRVLNDRAVAKLRAGDKGWESVARKLEAHGAPPCPDAAAGRRSWAEEWIRRLCRGLWHRGNHRYVWALDRALRRTLPPGLPYPKFTERPPCP